MAVASNAARADLRGARRRPSGPRPAACRRHDRRRRASGRRPSRRGPPASSAGRRWSPSPAPSPMISFFVAGSQPRTSTLLTCATALIRARKSSRSSPQTSGCRIGAQGLALGRARTTDSTGFLNSSVLAVDPAVVADLAREAVQEVEVGLVRLEHVVVGALGLVDVRREPGGAGQLGRDVRVLRVQERLRLAARGQAVRPVVAADDGAACRGRRTRSRST